MGRQAYEPCRPSSGLGLSHLLPLLVSRPACPLALGSGVNKIEMWGGGTEVAIYPPRLERCPEAAADVPVSGSPGNQMQTCEGCISWAVKGEMGGNDTRG